MLRINKGERMPKHDVIPTPSVGLNHVIGGGLWTGRFSLVWGTPSAGKTTMLLHLLAEAQCMGYTAVIVDTEGSITDDWSEKCGLDLDNRILLQSRIAEDILKHIIPMMQEKEEKYIFLIDSINGIASESFYKDAEGSGGIASQSRSRRLMYQKMAQYLNVNNAVIMVAQQTMDLSGNHPRLMAKVGNAELHWTTNIINLFASAAKDSLERAGDSDLIVNRQVRWTIEKSKQAPVEGTRGSYWFSPQNAEIDTKMELLDLAVINGVVEKRGAWFYFGEEKFHGMKNLVEAADDDLMEKIQTALDSTTLITDDGEALAS
jgi:recombination protein RecA